MGVLSSCSTGMCGNDAPLGERTDSAGDIISWNIAMRANTPASVGGILAKTGTFNEGFPLDEGSGESVLPSANLPPSHYQASASSALAQGGNRKSINQNLSPLIGGVSIC
jgi:hypothetical protein